MMLLIMILVIMMVMAMIHICDNDAIHGGIIGDNDGNTFEMGGMYAEFWFSLQVSFRHKSSQTS